MKAFTVTLKSLSGTEAQPGINLGYYQGLAWLWIGNYDGREETNNIGVPALTSLSAQLEATVPDQSDYMWSDRRLLKASIGPKFECELHRDLTARVPNYCLQPERPDDQQCALVFFDMKAARREYGVRRVSIDLRGFKNVLEHVDVSSDFNDFEDNARAIHWHEALVVMEPGDSIQVKVHVNGYGPRARTHLVRFDGQNVLIIHE